MNIKLVVVNKAASDKVWYNEHIGHLFFVTDTTDETLFAVVQPAIGKDFDLRIHAGSTGNGVLRVTDVQVLLVLNVAV